MTDYGTDDSGIRINRSQLELLDTANELENEGEPANEIADALLFISAEWLRRMNLDDAHRQQILRDFELYVFGSPAGESADPEAIR